MLQPDFPAALGLLAHLNSDELKEMLNDDNKFDAVLKDVHQIKAWETEKEMIIASNRSLAEFSLAREPELVAAREALRERSALGEELCTSIREKLEDYKSKSAGVSSDTTLALLQTAAAQCEESTESMAQELLDGDMELDKFLEEFLPARKKMHLRKFKADKMTELLRASSQYSMFGNGGKSYSPYPNYFPPAPQANVPYPVGPMHMPMPGMYGNHF